MITSSHQHEDQVLLPRFDQALEHWIGSFETSSPTAAMLRYHFGYEETAPRRGKRLRPRVLLAVAAEEAPSDVAERVINDALAAACAIELLHNYSLIHDDIEDGDQVRHGRKTVWANYGMPHGINTGDALCSLSYLSLLTPERIADPARAARMAACLHEANLAMCWGQGFDLAFEDATHVTYEQYLAMIEGKTAALFGAACALGALAADAPPARVAAYAALGAAYGRAFQIRDDILGIWGETATTGKPSGADVRRRKWSFPIVWALSHTQPDAHAPIAHAYAQRQPLSEEAAHSTIHCLEQLGARAAADMAVQSALDTAEALASEAGLDQSGRLRQLLSTSMHRRA